MKLIIGIPTYGKINTETVSCLLSAIPLCPQPVCVSFRSNVYVHLNREIIFVQAVEDGYSHLMFIDTDMKFENDAIARLLDQDKDIIGANYNHRGLPLDRTTVRFIDDDGGLYAPDILPTTTFKCAVVPTGFMLINIERCSQIPMPRFWFDIGSDGNMIGEDVYFCLKARSLGLEIWCDPTINVKHTGDFDY